MAAKVTLKANSKLREEMQSERIPLWMIADELGMSDTSLCRLLRHELSEENNEKVRTAISKILKERG